MIHTAFWKRTLMNFPKVYPLTQIKLIENISGLAGSFSAVWGELKDEGDIKIKQR